MEKHYVSPDDLRLDSFILGAQIYKSGFKPDFMIALWRGGAPVGCYVHELLKYAGVNVDHIAVRTSKYTGIDEASSTVKVYNLRYLAEHINHDSKVLIVDDIADSGHSINAVIEALSGIFGGRVPEIKIATLFYKPTRHKYPHKPDWYVHETDQWVVFPHEISEMSQEEINAVLGQGISLVLKTLKQ